MPASSESAFVMGQSLHFLKVLSGTAKAVPYPEPIYETHSSNCQRVLC